MIWLQITQIVLATIATLLCLRIVRLQRKITRSIRESSDLFRQLLPRIERLEKKFNVPKKADS